MFLDSNLDSLHSRRCAGEIDKLGVVKGYLEKKVTQQVVTLVEYPHWPEYISASNPPQYFDQDASPSSVLSSHITTFAPTS